MKAIVVKTTTYETIGILSKANGVSVGNYAYYLDGEVIDGWVDGDTEQLKDLLADYIPIVKVFCTDGWLDATDYNNCTLKKYIQF